jgi:UMP-CMP kinase
MIVEGKLVPGKITVELIKKAMQKHGWNSKQFLIDGFPRSEDNLKGWEEVMGCHADMRFVLYLECSEEAMIERIMARGAAAGDQKRNDDNIETLQKRFTVFKEQSMPIVKLYEAQNKVKRIDATKTQDEVYAKVK